jgi:Ca-activated chloride channel homolog
MISWSSSQNILLDSLEVNGPDDERFLEAIDNLHPDGGTNLYAGLVAGYKLAAKNFVKGGMNRVVLVSDCQVNSGVLNEEIVAEAAAGAESDAIYLVGVGVSERANGFPDEFMDTITEKGKGAYVYIDSAEEAHKMFYERFMETMEIVAADVDVKVVLPTFFSIEDFFGEKLSKESKDVESQHLAPGDTMVLQETVRSLLPLNDVLDQKIEVEISYTDVETSNRKEIKFDAEFGQLLNGPYTQLRKGDTIVVYAQTLGKTYRQIDRAKKLEAIETCEIGLKVVEQSAKALDDEELDEIAELLETYCRNLEDEWVPDYSNKNMWNCMICEDENTVSAEIQKLRDEDIIIATPTAVFTP